MTRTFGRCNLCGWPIVRIGPGALGVRCVRCLSTPIHRAVGLVVASQGRSREASVYGLSARGALFRYLKRRFPASISPSTSTTCPPGARGAGSRARTSSV